MSVRIEASPARSSPTRGRETPCEINAPARRSRGWDSFRAASAGVLRCVSSQRNMKLHALAALMVCIVGMALPLPVATRVAWLFAIALVFFAEVLNTALEAIVDLYIGEFHRLAMLAKDAAAGGVLILATATVLIFLDTLWSEWALVLEHPEAVKRSLLFGVPLVALEAMGLFWMRRGLLSQLRLLLALGLLLPLVRHSADPVFAGLALLLLAVSYHARRAFPRHRGRGAPPRAPPRSSRAPCGRREGCSGGIGAAPGDR